MKKSTLSISIDNEKIQELTDTASAMHMKRSTYVETLIERANKCYDFLRYVSIQAFDSERKATMWAINSYNNFQTGSSDVDACFYGNSFDLKMNKVLFKREVKEINNTE